MGRVSDPEQARLCFRRLRELARRPSRQLISTISWKEFSMDILDDEPIAGEAEATMVRLVLATFGVWRA